MEKIFVNPDKFKAKDFINLFKKIKSKEIYANEKYELQHKKKKWDEEGQGHVEFYSYLTESVSVSLKGKSRLEYEIEKEWEFYYDGNESRTKTSGVIKFYDNELLAQEIIENIKKQAA